MKSRNNRSKKPENKPQKRHFILHFCNNKAFLESKVIDWILSDRARVLNVTGQLGYGAWLMPLHYEDSDFDPNIDPRQKRFLTEFAEATGTGNYGYTTWTFYPNDPGVHIWKDMEVVWAGDITPLEFMEESQRLWDKARADDALVPVGKR